MARNEDEPLVRKHVWLSQRDWERTEMYFANNLGTSKALRVMMRSFLNGIEAKASAKAARPSVEIDLGDDLNE